MPDMLDIEPLIQGYRSGQQMMPVGMAASTINLDGEEVFIALIHPKMWEAIHKLLGDQGIDMHTDPRSNWDGEL